MRGPVREPEHRLPAGLPLTDASSLGEARVAPAAPAAPAAHLIAWGGAAVLVATALARLPFRRPEGGQAHLALAQELVAAAGVALLAFAAARARLAIARDRVSLLVGALAVLEVVSATLAPNPWMALRASGLLLGGFATFLVARATGGVRGAAPLGMVLLVAVSVALEAFGVLPGLSRTGHAPGGAIGERNAAAELLVCALPFVAWVAVRAERRALRHVALATAGLAAMDVVLSRTRSAWISLAALAALGLALAWRTDDDAMRGRAAGVLVAAALGIALAIVAPTKLSWSSPHPYRDTATHLLDTGTPSAAGRLAQYRTTLKMAAAHPLAGVGPGNWGGQYSAYAPPSDPTIRDGFAPTNRLPSGDLLGFVAERGLLATAALLALLVHVLRASRDRWLQRATLLSAVLVGSLDAVLQLAPHLLFVAWILGANSTSPPVPTSARPLGVPAFAAAALLATVATALAACRAVAFALFVHAHSFDDLERAARLDPGDVPTRLAIAEDWIEAGRCDRARPHLDAAARWAARTPAASGLEARCR